jgi:preprotein translocase subunit Sec63
VDSAACDDIKAAFRRVAMQLHPDRQSRLSDAAREKATAQFLQVRVSEFEWERERWNERTREREIERGRERERESEREGEREREI